MFYSQPDHFLPGSPQGSVGSPHGMRPVLQLHADDHPPGRDVPLGVSLPLAVRPDAGRVRALQGCHVRHQAGTRRAM